MTETQFKNSPEGFVHIKRNIAKVAVSLSILVLLVLVFFNYVTSDPSSEGNFDYLMISIPLFIIFLIYIYYSNVKKYKVNYNSFTLTFDGRSITSNENDHATISIPYADIESITRASNGSMTVSGKNPDDKISVPFYINDYEKVESMLSTITSKPITQATETGWKLKTWLIAIASLILVLVFFSTKNPVVTVITGVISLTALVYSLYKISNSKLADNSMKKGRWATLFVILGIVLRMYYVLFGEL